MKKCCFALAIILTPALLLADITELCLGTRKQDTRLFRQFDVTYSDLVDQLNDPRSDIKSIYAPLFSYLGTLERSFEPGDHTKMIDLTERVASRFEAIAQTLETKTTNEILKTCNVSYQVPAAKLAAPIICADASSDCISAVRRIIDIQSPCALHSTLKLLSIRHVVSEFASDPNYSAPLWDLYKKIKDKINLAQSGKKVDLGNIWTDSITSMKKFGISQEDSRTMSLKFLGLYGARGADSELYFRLIDRTNNKQFLILSMISSSLSKMDDLTILGGRRYSLPENIVSKCSYARPYHFWMSAFLANSLKNEGFNDRSIVQAINRVGSAYEIKADVATNANYQSPTLETQKDILFNDIGATWAIKSRNAQNFQINADSLLEKMMITSSNNTFSGRCNTTEYGRFFDPIKVWSCLHAPEAHLDELLKVLD